MAQFVDTLSDRVRVGALPYDAAGYKFVHGKVVNARRQTVSLRSSLTYRFKPGVILADTLKLRLTMRPITAFGLKVYGGKLRLKSASRVGILVNLLGRIELVDTQRVTPLVVMREKLRLMQRQQIAHTFALVMRSALRLRDTTKVGLGATVREALTITGKLDRLYRAAAAVTEALELGDQLSPQLRIVVIEAEGVTIGQRDIERMILAGRLDDAMAFTAGIYEPAGSTTTWAVNARTGAVTEYTGYGFNSFARFGTGYIAAGDGGLYELAGDTDAGQPIVADMISGLLEMTGSNLTSLKAAYIAARGPGEWFLKLTANEGREATYRVLTSSLRTARVNVGKGWRARYFTYQIVSTGQDFDLEGIEFLPVASVRRI